MTIVRLPFAYRAVLMAMLVAVSVLLLLIMRLLVPTQPVSIKEPIAVFGAKTLHAGDPIEFVIDYCADTEAFGWVSGIFASAWGYRSRGDVGTVHDCGRFGRRIGDRA